MRVIACVITCAFANHQSLSGVDLSAWSSNVENIETADVDHCVMLQTRTPIVNAAPLGVEQRIGNDEALSELPMQLLPNGDMNLVGKWFFPISSLTFLVAFMSLMCVCCSRCCGTNTSQSSTTAKHPCHLEPPLCPTFVSMKALSLWLDTTALEVVSEDGCDIFGDSGTPSLRVKTFATDIVKELSISISDAAPRASAACNADRSFREEVADGGVRIYASDGEIFGRLKRQSDKRYQVVRDSDRPVMSLAHWSAPPPQALVEHGVRHTEFIDAALPNGQLIASIVQTHGVRGRTEFHIQPGADVALVIVGSLALMLFGRDVQDETVCE